MLFMFLMAGSVYLSVYALINLPCHPLLSALLAFVIYFVTASLSTIIAVFLSLLLGRTDKFVLRKKTRYYVREFSDGYIKFFADDARTIVVPILDITETRTDTEELCPYIEIEHYNIGGWRKLFLLSIYEDTIKYILYTNDEIY